MGTRAELDSLNRELAYLLSKNQKLMEKYHKLEEALETMTTIKGEFEQLEKDVNDCIKSYNKDGKEWRGAHYEEIKAASTYSEDYYKLVEELCESIDGEIWKFEQDRTELQIQINNLDDRIKYFELDEEDTYGF